MSTFNEITNPLTNEKLSIFSIAGKNLLKQYVKLFNNGGSSDEEPLHYPVATINVSKKKQKKGWKLIPVNKILYDNGMKAKAKKVCNDIAREKRIVSKKNTGGFNLHKWDSVWNNFENKTPLDPITVKTYRKPYYEVIDGRHRATASLCYGYDFVPAFIKNN